MSHRQIAEVIAHFQGVTTFEGAIQCWLTNSEKIKGTTLLFTFNDIGAELPIEAAIANHDGEKFYIRSAFSRPKAYFLNESIWLTMFSRENIHIPVESFLCLDTQFGNYACRYLSDPNFRDTEIGQSVHNLLTYLYQEQIVFEYSFYLCENFSNYRAGMREEVKAQLGAFVTMADADRELFLETGRLQLPYKKEQFEKRVADLLAPYHNREQRKEYGHFELLQSKIATMLCKAILLKRDNGSNPRQKIAHLIDFMHEELSCNLAREFFICAQWLLGKKISFFDPVNAGPGYLAAPQRIHGMAWDLMMLRHVERACAVTGQGKPTIAYFSSFDRRMIEVSDLWKSKGCLYPPVEKFGRYFMISEEDILTWLRTVVGEEKAHEVFNDRAWKQRDESRPSSEEVFSVRRAYEGRVIKILQPDIKKQSVHGIR